MDKTKENINNGAKASELFRQYKKGAISDEEFDKGIDELNLAFCGFCQQFREKDTPCPNEHYVSPATEGY